METRKEIDKRNKVFAKFMELKEDEIMKEVDKERAEKGLPKGSPMYKISDNHISNLLYHFEWKWIMSVIDKIEQIGASVIIGKMFCEIKYIDSLDPLKQFQLKIVSGVKINAVNSAVFEFIKWYKKNNK